MNIIIDNGNVLPTDQHTLFQDEEVITLPVMTLPDLLVQMKVYKSKSECARAGRTGPIPDGFTELKASKKVTMWIWNPTE